ncbi:hypothetical protein EAS64_21055 [Trebonia kvetii]|uniref:Uncharacterized protein n=1 Tax=Trebonia kvetii TaxID=2480626 RepID=A0A6P2BVN4_9ACTN|nr:hypothetical protein [Trebonia kvetii]TVZ02960.1 hypothetical protein EAS64_21055 [Trebonia kvetii]
MNISYLLYQAERPLTAAQQREADITTGQMAAAIGRAGHSLRLAVTGNAGTKRANHRPAVANCAVPRPREAQ